MVSSQLHLGLETAPSFRRDDFVVADANAEATARVDGLTAGPLALVGPAGVGKSHLAQAWAQAHGARILAGDAALGALPPRPGPVLVEDVDRAGAPLGELLFHLINRAAEAQAPLLLTARSAPQTWATGVPDLRSRLNALPVVELAEPDEAALAGLLQRFFRERGVAASPELVAFLLRRIERSAAHAREVVRRLDDAAHATGRPVGRGLAREVLGESG